MRDFFINSLEKLVNVIVVLLGLVVLAMAAAAFTGRMHGPMGGAGPLGGGGILAGILVLVAGSIYVIVVGGFLYMGIGIYQNTRRSAEALEKMAGKQG